MFNWCECDRVNSLRSLRLTVGLKILGSASMRAKLKRRSALCLAFPGWPLLGRSCGGNLSNAPASAKSRDIDPVPARRGGERVGATACKCEIVRRRSRAWSVWSASKAGKTGCYPCALSVNFCPNIGAGEPGLAARRREPARRVVSEVRSAGHCDSVPCAVMCLERVTASKTGPSASKAQLKLAG